MTMPLQINPKAILLLIHKDYNNHVCTCNSWDHFKSHKTKGKLNNESQTLSEIQIWKTTNYTNVDKVKQTTCHCGWVWANAIGRRVQGSTQCASICRLVHCVHQTCSTSCSVCQFTFTEHHHVNNVPHNSSNILCSTFMEIFWYSYTDSSVAIQRLFANKSNILIPGEGTNRPICIAEGNYTQT